MLFRHPSSLVGSGFSLVTRCLPRLFNDLANISARLDNYSWLRFIITGLSPDKKRHAWHGAQRFRIPNPFDSARFHYFYHAPSSIFSQASDPPARSDLWCCVLLKTSENTLIFYILIIVLILFHLVRCHASNLTITRRDLVTLAVFLPSLSFAETT